MSPQALWQSYESPLGSMTIAASSAGIIGIWFDGQAHDRSTLPPDAPCLRPGEVIPGFDAAARHIREAAAWLDAYFAGAPLPALPSLDLVGTPFRRRVWVQLCSIAPGTTVTYGELARALSAEGTSGSARAVGGAVGRNPVSILIPCHRVLGADGSITGYAGGPDRKTWLLRHEGIDLPH